MHACMNVWCAVLLGCVLKYWQMNGQANHVWSSPNWEYKNKTHTLNEQLAKVSKSCSCFRTDWWWCCCFILGSYLKAIEQTERQPEQIPYHMFYIKVSILAIQCLRSCVFCSLRSIQMSLVSVGWREKERKKKKKHVVFNNNKK